jgi:hypothetical protein
MQEQARITAARLVCCMTVQHQQALRVDLQPNVWVCGTRQQSASRTARQYSLQFLGAHSACLSCLRKQGYHCLLCLYVSMRMCTPATTHRAGDCVC